MLCSMIRQRDLITHDTLMHFNLFFFEQCQIQSFALKSISKKKKKKENAEICFYKETIMTI